MKTILSLAFFFGSITIANAASCHGAKINYKSTPEAAYYDSGTHSITIDPAFLNQYSKPVQRFIISHECGHASGIYNERRADLYAIRQNRKSLTPEVVSELCRDYTSHGDPARCTYLKKHL